MMGAIPIEILLQNKFAENQVKKGLRPLQIQDTKITINNIMIKEKSFHFPQYRQLNNLQILEDMEPTTKVAPEIEIYTDGSVMEENKVSVTTSAFTVKHNETYVQDHSFRHHTLNTICQAELFAIQSSTDWFINSPFNSVLILSDSHSSVEALKIVFPRNSIITHIYQQLLKHPDKQVYVQWTRAHVGTEGNERADSIAKQAITNNLYDDLIHLSFPLSVVRNFFF